MNKGLRAGMCRVVKVSCPVPSAHARRDTRTPMSAAVLLLADRGMTDTMARIVGRIAQDRRGNYVLAFRVPMPDGSIRRMEVRGSKLFGPFGKDRSKAELGLNTIREECPGRELYQVLEEYRLLSSIHSSFGALWGLWLEAESERERDGEVTASRVRNLRSCQRMGHLKPLWRLPVRLVGYRQLDDLKRTLRASDLKAVSVRHILSDVGLFLKWLRRRGDISAVPEMPTVFTPEAELYVPVIPTEETKRRLVDAIPEPIRGFWIARGYMGLRAREARLLRVSWWEREVNMLQVRVTKTRTPRTLPLHELMREWLEKHIDPVTQLQGDPLLFQNPNGQHPDLRWVASTEKRVWARACQAVGVKFKQNEALRHSFATHAAARQVESFALQAYMGHASPATTNRYIKLSGKGLVGVLRPKK